MTIPPSPFSSCRALVSIYVELRARVVVHWRLGELALLDAGAHSCPLPPGDLHLIPGPNHQLRGQSWPGLSSWPLASPFFSPSTHGTAPHCSQTSLCPRRLLYYRRYNNDLPILRLAAAATHHTTSHHPTPTPTRWSRPSVQSSPVHCCSPLRASQTRQSAQKLRTSPSHHPLPPTLANAQYRPNRHANHPKPRPQSCATRLDLKSPRPSPPTLSHTLETLHCQHYCNTATAPRHA